MSGSVVSSSQPATAADSPKPAAKVRLALITTEGSTLRYLARGQPARLRRAGFEVHLISNPDPDLERAAEREGVEARGVPMTRSISPLRDLASLKRLVGTLRRIDPHIVNASTPKAGVLGTLAARLAGVRTRIYTIRGLRLETETGFKRLLLSRADRMAAAAATQVYCVSESLRQRAIELGLIEAAKARVLGSGSSNGVDTRRYRPARPEEPESERLRRRWQIPAAAPILGFVGRLSRDKGLDDAAKIFLDRILPAHPDARLLLLGRLDHADPVDPALLDRLTRHPQVVRVGFEDDISTYYRLMDVLVFPSRREGFPNAPLEAAASGLPVAGYAVTGTVDAVQHGVTGTLVPSGDRGGLAEAVLGYLADDELRRRHGEAGRQRAAREFRRELVWQAWEEAYGRLLEAREAGDAL